MRNIEARISKLEDASEGERTAYVARIKSNGSIHYPRNLGERYALLPEKCATTEEWLAQLRGVQ